MGALTIRNLDDGLISAIKRRAAENDLSMEEEVRRLLASKYGNDQLARQREWAQRQLERLKRGELPTSDEDSVETLRRMREERDEQLVGLRNTLDTSIARGGAVTDEQLDAALAAESAELAKQGF